MMNWEKMLNVSHDFVMLLAFYLKEKLLKLKTTPVQGLHSRVERAPWIRAQNMEEELRTRGDDLLHSSVRFISSRAPHAEYDFVQAVVIAAAYAVSYSSCSISLSSHRV